MQFEITKDQRNILDSLHGVVACKDLNSVFLYGNRENSELVGLKNPEDIIGRTNLDLPCEAAVKCHHTWHAQDTIVMEERRPLEILDIHPFSNGWKAFIFKKNPLWNVEKTEVIGTIFHGIDITRESVLKVFNSLSKRIGKTDNELLTGQNSKILTKKIDKPPITVKQTEVLFLLLFGKTTKDIGEILKISTNTVSVHIDRLKEKFSASNKSELIDKAYSLGIEKLIPKSLFNKRLSLILE